MASSLTPAVKAKLKTAMRLAAQAARTEGRAYGIWQRVDEEEVFTVYPLKYGEPPNRFEWRRVATVRSKEE